MKVNPNWYEWDDHPWNLSYRHQHPDLPNLRCRQVEGPEGQVAYPGGYTHLAGHRGWQHRGPSWDVPLPSQDQGQEVHAGHTGYHHCADSCLLLFPEIGTVFPMEYLLGNGTSYYTQLMPLLPFAYRKEKDMDNENVHIF